MPALSIIDAFAELLEQLRIAGCIVTTDAMGCQKTIARTIRDKEAGYCLQLKENHPKVYDEVSSYFTSEIGDSLLPSDDTFVQTVDGDHGRIEIRRHWLSTDIGWFDDAHLWADLGAFGMVESERTVGDKTSIHRRYRLAPSAMLRTVLPAARMS